MKHEDETFWTHETHEGRNPRDPRRNISNPRGQESHAI